MSGPPRPRRQSALAEKLKVFAAGISADPARYNLVEEEASEIQSAVDAFVQALAVVNDEDTNTRPAVRDKDQKRRIAEEVHSAYYNLIKADPGVSDVDKIAIGVRPVNLERAPIRVPRTVPLLKPIMATPHRHVLRFEDANTPKSCGKPHGAVFLQLYAAMGEEKNLKVESAREVGLFTRNPIMVRYESEENRRQVTYYGRWISRKGEKGLWSLPTSMAVLA